MLLNMHIKNIALIDEIDISFENGFNVLTGETGAGKSIIMGSLGIGLGGRFHKELLRDEAEDGLVELTFLVDNPQIKKQLEQIEIYPVDDEVLITRRLGAGGRTINRINDNTVTTGKLREAADVLVDLHAQHEQQDLLNIKKHMEILDKFGGQDIASVKDKIAHLYKEYIDIAEKIRENTIDESQRIKEMDFLKFRIDEINNSMLEENEDVRLEGFYKKAVNSKDILTIAEKIYSLTGYTEQSSVAGQINSAITFMNRLVELDPDLRDTYTILQDVDGMLNDFNRELKDYMENMEFEPEEFNRVEERLNQINSLKAKYGRSYEEIMNTLKSYEEEYSRLADYDDFINSLLDSFRKTEKELILECDRLTGIRKEYSKKLCDIIRRSLVDLNFNSVEFDMEFQKKDKFTAHGNDEAYFVISTNVGEKMKPLYQIASGGELSRVMLAIKACLANEDDTPTLVFDEIDVGISGRTAQKVAEKIAYIAKNHQVICITHLPQIAAMADYHFLIEKNVENNKTITNIRRLKKAEETLEIARLLGGARITDATIYSAKEMKGLADREKIY